MLTITLPLTTVFYAWVLHSQTWNKLGSFFAFQSLMDVEEEDPTELLALVILVMTLNRGKEQAVDACAQNNQKYPPKGKKQTAGF